MSDASGFGKLVPGFDFLQSLVKNAGAALPGIGQWVAPTLDPAELDKRIGELRTVQYWLEQNARMLAATIQALEVQRMTLSTLKTMNVQMGDARRVAEDQAARAGRRRSRRRRRPAPSRRRRRRPPPKKAPAAKSPAGAVDPMQWWGALTNQFAELATSAMKDSAADAAKALAGSMMKQSFDAAAETMKKVAGAPGRAVAGAAKSLAPKAAGATPREEGGEAPRPSGAAPRPPRPDGDRARRERAAARGRRALARPTAAGARPKSSPRSPARCRRTRCSGGARTPCRTNATA